MNGFVLEQEIEPLIDFEISLDETPFPTSPENHFFFALELSHRGVHIQSLAPRFLGEFQRGVDFHGDRRDLPQTILSACSHRRGLWEL